MPPSQPPPPTAARAPAAPVPPAAVPAAGGPPALRASAPRIPRTEPLGQVLVRMGLLTEQDLG